MSLWLLEQNVTLSSLPSLDAKFMPQKKVLTGAMAPPPSIATAETRKAYWAEQHRIIEEAYTPLTLSEQTATLGFDTLAYALDMIDDPEVLGAVFSRRRRADGCEKPVGRDTDDVGLWQQWSGLRAAAARFWRGPCSERAKCQRQDAADGRGVARQCGDCRVADGNQEGRS